MALVCSELGSAIPEEGGYYTWVRRAMGEFWGFQSGWWSWTCQWVDSAVYITLTLGYIESWIPLNSTTRWLLGVALIALFAYMNIRGLEVVAFSSMAFSIVILVPFVAMIVLGFAQWHVSPVSPFLPPGETFFGSVGLGLSIGMWMYSGYDSMSVMAGEIEEPQRIIPRALMIAVPIIVAAYVLPTITGIAGVGGWNSWATEGGTSFVEVARSLGGRVLGGAMLAAAVVSNVALYVDYLASGSRPAYAMAADRLLPAWVNKAHPKYGTPYLSILLLAAINCVLILGTFADLIVIDIFLNMFYLILIYVAAIILRRKEPQLVRPFRIRTGTRGLVLLSIPPIAIAVLALFTNGTEYMIGGALAALSGPVAYVILKRRYGGTAPRRQRVPRTQPGRLIGWRERGHEAHTSTTDRR
jgi:amino acid transporter